jgi:hypothetical protein
MNTPNELIFKTGKKTSILNESKNQFPLNVYRYDIFDPLVKYIFWKSLQYLSKICDIHTGVGYCLSVVT